MDEVYIGSAVSRISKRSDIVLPPTFRRTARIRAGSPKIFLLIDRHPDDHCLIVSDRAFVDGSTADAQSTLDVGERDDVARRRRFAFAVETELHPHGILPLPPLARRMLPLGNSVLLVSTGHQFQIWDLDFVMAQGAPDLIALAKLHRAGGTPSGDYHEPLLPFPVAPRPFVVARESRLPLQPVQPMPRRLDAIGATGRR